MKYVQKAFIYQSLAFVMNKNNISINRNAAGTIIDL
jgi:hypothetical protein